MIKLFVALILFLVKISYSQNLVLNPSFEEYHSKPSPSYAQIDQCKNWQNAYGSVEYYRLDSYAPAIYGIPRTGLSFIDYSTYIDPNLGNNYLEYPTGSLSNQLIVGRIYHVSFYTEKWNRSIYATEMGLLFTMNMYNATTNPINVPNRAHIRSKGVVGTVSGYHLVEGVFKADSNYSNFIIGSMFDSSILMVQSVSGANQAVSFYLVDDVSVIDVSPIQPTITGIHTVCDSLANKENTYFEAQGEALQWQLPSGLTTSITGFNTSLSGVSINFTSAGIYMLTVNSTNQYGALSAVHIVSVIGCTIPTVPGIQTCLGQTCTIPITCTGSNCANCFGIVCTLPSLPCGGVCPENTTCVSNVCTSLTSPLPTCTGVSCDTVIIPPVEPLRVFKIYNTFTPNGDGINDTWVIDSLYPPNKITILDKWGNLLYEVSPYTNDWDGNRDGSRLPSGTYYFILEYGDKKRQAGVVNIIR